MLDEIDARLDAIRRAHPALSIDRGMPSLVDDALDTPIDSPVVRAAIAANAATGFDPVATTVPYGSDASKLSVGGGIPTIVYGPGDIAHAHGAHEHVALAEVTGAAAFYRAVATATEWTNDALDHAR